LRIKLSESNAKHTQEVARERKEHSIFAAQQPINAENSEMVFLHRKLAAYLKGKGVVLREPTFLQTAKLKNPARANNKTNTEPEID
jgi:hypothetical protein